MSTVHALQPTLSFISETTLPTRRGTFVIRAYRDPTDGSEPIAMLRGDLLGQENVPVRVHDACLTSEVFGSLKCDCRDQLEFALDHLEQTDLGVVIYLPQEGRGIGLANKLAAYRLQEAGHDTVDANRQGCRERRCRRGRHIPMLAPHPTRSPTGRAPWDISSPRRSTAVVAGA